jgi:hypothetical protein
LGGETVGVNDQLTVNFLDFGALFGAIDGGAATDGRNANENDQKRNEREMRTRKGRNIPHRKLFKKRIRTAASAESQSRRTPEK